MGHNAIMPDILITCPLDESHRILKSRMQFHITRCLKNHKLDGKKLKCPWNPLHIIDQFYWEDHYTNKCEDLPNVMGSTVRIKDDEIQRDVGSIPLGAVNALLPIPTEDWDAEPGPSGTYDPSKKAEGMPVLRTCVGLSKAKKKAWIQSERRRHQQLEHLLPLQTQSTSKQLENIVTTKPVQRHPRSMATAMSTNVSMIEDLNASRNSQDMENKSKSPKTVRPPHTSDQKKSVVNNETRNENVRLFDECYGYDKSNNNGMEKSWNIRNDTNGLDSDGRSTVSTTSSCNTKLEAIRKLVEQTLTATKSFASVASSSSLPKEISKNETAKDQANPLQNNAASLPSAVASRSKAAVIDVDVVDQLRQRLVNLTTMDSRSFEAEKATIIAQLSQLTPNVNNSSASVDENLEHPKVKHPANAQANGFSKCAAYFPKLKKPENGKSVTEDRVDTDIESPKKSDRKTSKISSTLND